MVDTNPEKPVLFLLPGLLCDAPVFGKLVPLLEDVADIHIPNFFGLDSIETMAEHVLAQAPQRFSMLGFSMGGRVAMEVIRRAPERIDRLLLLDTGTHAATQAELPERHLLVKMGHEQGMEAVASRWLPPMLHPDRRNDPAFMGPLTEMVCRAGADVHDKQIQAQITRPDAAPVLPGIKCPTYVITGRQDEWSNVARHAVIAAAIPGSKLVVLEDSGHFTPLEAPQALAAAMREWLAIPVD